MKIYKHKKTGNLYALVQDHLLCKTIVHSERLYSADPFDVEFKDAYEWDRVQDKRLVLYKALYKSSDGPFFVRFATDFYNSFEFVKEEGE